MIYRDIPNDEVCWLINYELWQKFEEAFNLDNGFMPRPEWSEAEVVQYLDQKETTMTTEIFILNEDYVWRSGGTVSHMYLVNRYDGSYTSYDSDRMIKDVSCGLSILIRPASKSEIEWADRKLNFYRSEMRRFGREQFALD